MGMDVYHTIETTAMAEFRDRGSRFTAFAFPLTEVHQFKKIIQDLKKQHPKAVHYCFAYRLGLTVSNFRVSDDGEPPGTAGRQILGQIDSKGLTDILVVVVRYFGGTLLGVPGLIHAYKTASSLVLQTVPVSKKNIEVTYILRFHYEDLNEILKVIKQCKARVSAEEMQLFPWVQVEVPIVSSQLFVASMDNLRNVEKEQIV